MRNDNIEEQLKLELEKFKTAIEYIEKVKKTAIDSQKLLNDLSEKYTALNESQSKSIDSIDNISEQIADINKQLNNITKQNAIEDIRLIKSNFENKMNEIIFKINKENSEKINLITNKINKIKAINIVFIAIAITAIILGLLF